MSSDTGLIYSWRPNDDCLDHDNSPELLSAGLEAPESRAWLPRGMPFRAAVNGSK